VEDVLAAVAAEAGRDAHVCVGPQEDGVLPTGVIRSGLAATEENPEVDQVQVYGMDGLCPFRSESEHVQVVVGEQRREGQCRERHQRVVQPTEHPPVAAFPGQPRLDEHATVRTALRRGSVRTAIRSAEAP
jgi:hypothetical protein